MKAGDFPMSPECAGPNHVVITTEQANAALEDGDLGKPVDAVFEGHRVADALLD